MKLFAMLGAVVLVSGCTADLTEQNALLAEENENLRAQLSSRNGALTDAQQDLRERQSQIAQLRRELNEAERSRGPSPAVTGFENITGVSATFSNGEITVTVQSDVLFDSGKTSLKNTAKQSLQAVASVLNSSYGSRPVRIEGYTDTDPIRKSGHKSNYHLGFERAYAVRDFLISKNVNAKRISLASFGPDRPLGSKANSRRVEIIVVAE
ncbi:MAG: OmpA family protein [Phycisphaerales bacterium]